jgi:hypothetical protein
LVSVGREEAAHLGAAHVLDVGVGEDRQLLQSRHAFHERGQERELVSGVELPVVGIDLPAELKDPDVPHGRGANENLMDLMVIPWTVSGAEVVRAGVAAPHQRVQQAGDGGAAELAGHLDGKVVALEAVQPAARPTIGDVERARGPEPALCADESGLLFGRGQQQLGQFAQPLALVRRQQFLLALLQSLSFGGGAPRVFQGELHLDKLAAGIALLRQVIGVSHVRG